MHFPTGFLHSPAQPSLWLKFQGFRAASGRGGNWPPEVGGCTEGVQATWCLLCHWALTTRWDTAGEEGINKLCSSQLLINPSKWIQRA